MNAECEQMWRECTAALGISHDARHDVVAFAETPAVQTALAALTAKGVKRATTALARWYVDGGEAMPSVGGYLIVVDGDGIPACICRTTAVETRRFDDVDAEFAFVEGEGDRSLAYWRDVHRAFFAAEAARGGFTFMEDDDVVLERFERIWPAFTARDRELTVVLSAINLAEPERGWVKSYDFTLHIDGSSEPAGRVNVRECHTPFLTHYAGLIGYSVEPAFRGRRLAGRAVALLVPFIRKLGNSEAWITCNPDNVASRRTLERLGAEFVEIVTLPPGNPMYDAGDREKCRYRLAL